MTENVNIKRGDLHLAVSAALSRGRYVLMTGGGGELREITLDLAERDDDLFGEENWGGGTRHGNAASFGFDDHGPTIPAQGGLDLSKSPDVTVYEFSLQEYRENWGEEATLDDVALFNAPDMGAAKHADWVHVYDRVTRERRTLKRPEPDAVLTGLRDVAADLRRGQPTMQNFADNLKAMNPGAPVEPPFGCAPLPPVGPLTSTEGLRAGDVLRVIKPVQFGGKEMAVGNIVTAHRIEAGDIYTGTTPDGWRWNRFAFVGRPDVDGWMAWAGGDNPVPGADVAVRFGDESVDRRMRSEAWMWTHCGDHPRDIVAFRIVDANQQKEDPS